MEDIKKLAEELANTWLKAYDTYKPLVKDACNRLVSEKELEWLFDGLLDVCAYSKNDELFFELCETYEGFYTDCVHDYKKIHDELFKE